MKLPWFRLPPDPEPSPFCRQVLTAMAMEPDSFHIYEDRRSFNHPQLGMFRIGWLTGRITVSEQRHARKLTRDDQRLIHKELDTLLTRPVPERSPPRSAFEQAVDAGFTGSKSDWLQSLSGPLSGPPGMEGDLGVNFIDNVFQQLGPNEYLVTEELAKMLTKATHSR